MKSFFILTTLFFCSIIFAQDVTVNKVSDSLYREDQFYASLNYNLLQNRPSGYNQYSFSTGLSLGFIRDFPITKNRHWAIGTGIGYSYNNIKHNLIIENSEPENIYSVNGNYDKNKLVLHYVEFPLEIRWRNSTVDSHKFWRIYTGFKVSYLFGNKSVYKFNGLSEISRNNTDLNKIQYGPYLSWGYNTINFYAYYGLSPLFKDTKLSNGETLDLNNFNVGFIFYIL
ncbi:porin family protein [Flavobacterium sp.]|jgi:hypothetical protein|uniref:porin family protein n=1 Tax=Flavobacterium sp. TaxID=239 RepID=UPI002A818EF7|nr:porin family protein [Flavobacterium sp.]